MESKYKKIIIPFFFFFLYADPALQTGDIILRKEANILSDLFSQIDPCGYSHTGIIVIKHNKPYVLHIEYETSSDNLKLIPLNKFLVNSSNYAILEPKIKIDYLKLKKEISFLQKQKIKFDSDFSLNNKNLYCTELIDYIYYKLIHRHIYSYLYKFKNKRIITVKSILKSSYFKKIK